jgi:hypothetical protein
MSNPETLLRVLLYISAAVTLLAFPCTLLPVEWMDWTHQQLGLGELPRGPIVIYMARTLSLLYGMHGVMSLLLAGDVRRYLPLIRTVSWLMALCGVAILFIDWNAGLPWYWIAGEGPSIAVFYGLIGYVAGRVSG